MKVLGLNGSPRRGGNTDILLAELMRGAKSKGAETETIILSNLSVAPCTHCDACLKTGECVINDDMQTVYKALESADRIIIASPLHFMSLTAQMKLAVDRCQAIWARKYRLKIPPLGDTRERRGMYLGVGGRKVEKLFDAASEVVRSLFFVLNVTYAGALTFAGVDEKGAILKVPNALEKAFQVGQKLVAGEPLQ
jgi:NAD(P)H-dependent FMN reductase